MQRGAAGERRLVATLPPHPDEPRHDDDQRDLQEETEHRGEAAEAAEQAMAEQHAEQARAEEAGEHPAQEARTIEEAAAER